jgi:hypothetical protein
MALFMALTHTDFKQIKLESKSKSASHRRRNSKQVVGK